MPHYDYYCKSCDNEFEVFQSIKSDSVANCPTCNAIAERKISMPAGIVFKGSGFYINDYKDKSKSNGSSTSNSTKATSAKSETKSDTETKTETKSDTKSEPVKVENSSK